MLHVAGGIVPAEVQEKKLNGDMFLSRLVDICTPNKDVPHTSMIFIVGVWLVLTFYYWIQWTSPIIPKPMEIWTAFKHLWFEEGLVYELMASMKTNAIALVFTAVISLGLSYLTVLPFMRPVVAFVANLRFQGLTGLVLLFTLVFSGGQPLKVSLLVFGMTVFFVMAMADEIKNIPESHLDHARTLGMNEWEVVWEVIILGRAHIAWQIFRQNAAMGWMMLTMVEGISRSGGGVGAMLLDDRKHFNYAAVFAIQFVVLVVGMIQDFGFGAVGNILFPYAVKSQERRA